VNDTLALAELFRLLKPGGKAIVSSPIVEGWAETYENPAVLTTTERLIHFGQQDHVRFYGRDLRDRIRAAGFDLTEVTAVEPDVLTYGLIRGETLFIARKPG
jgi:SAM-dependent methyltransferase